MLQFIMQKIYSALFIFFYFLNTGIVYANLSACHQIWARMAADTEHFWRPTIRDIDPASKLRSSRIHIISEGQKGFSNSKQIDQIKLDMQKENFDYETSKLTLNG